MRDSFLVGISRIVDFVSSKLTSNFPDQVISIATDVSNFFVSYLNVPRNTILKFYNNLL
jgi:hypothetical protein